MSIRTKDAIAAARSLLGTPYSQLDCINLIKRVIRTAPGGVPGYTTAGTNTLWRSAQASAKYRDLVWRQEGLTAAAGTSSASPSASRYPQGGGLDARAGMLAFKRRGSDVHHVGIVAERPLCGMQRGEAQESQGAEGDYASSPGGNQLTVIHSSSTSGKVVETALDSSWQLLGIHRYIEVADDSQASDAQTLAADGQEDARETAGITIIDSEGNHFNPVGDWRVLIGSID